MLSTLTANLWRSRWSVELKRQDNDCVGTVRRRHSASHVLTDERGRRRGDVRAAVGRRDAQCASSVRMLAPRRGGGLRVTPDGAQQRDLRPCYQRQHDREDSCSEHVEAHLTFGKTGASLGEVQKAELPAISTRSVPRAGLVRDFAAEGAKNPAVQTQSRITGFDSVLIFRWHHC